MVAFKGTASDVVILNLLLATTKNEKMYFGAQQGVGSHNDCLPVSCSHQMRAR